MKDKWRIGLLLAGLVLAACSTMSEQEKKAAARKAALILAKKAETLFSQGKIEESHQAAMNALDKDPECLRAALVAADSSIELEMYEDAFDILLAPDPAPPADQKAARLRHAAELALEMGQPSLAVVYLNRAVETSPEEISLHVALGETAALGGCELDAIRAFERALELGGDGKEIAPGLAGALYTLDRFEEACTIMEKELSRGDLDPAGMILLGSILCSLDRTEEGLVLFRDAGKLDEGLAQACYNEGCALEALEDIDGAEAAYRRALERDPLFCPASFHLGCLLFKKGLAEQGLALIDKAIASEQDSLVKRALEKTRSGLLKGDEDKTGPENGTSEASPEKTEPASSSHQ